MSAFLLITSDPSMSGGSIGSAVDLVMARLQERLWPLYAGTRNRRRIDSGARVAFYVAGKRKLGGHLVAVAVVGQKRAWRLGDPRIDPDRFLTNAPDSVLELTDIQALEDPIRFRDRLKLLSFAPKNEAMWGAALMGGCRPLSDADWRVLIGPSKLHRNLSIMSG